MDRLVRRNVLALSGRAVEASGDVDVLLLDKTGTITLGNRQATEFIPMPGVTEVELAEAAQLASLADETPEGRSIVVLAKQYGIREHELAAHAEFVPFTAETRMSGVEPERQPDPQGRGRRDRAPWSPTRAARRRRSCGATMDEIAREGGTPLAVARDAPGARRRLPARTWSRRGCAHRFDQLRAMGIRTVMVTGDNPLTAAKIADEAGRRRLPRRGDPGAQAGADPRAAGRWPAGRDDRRRHQRRAGARAGRRRRGDEHRHPGGPRGGQHGRPRLEPDEADRDRRDRQAAADHPRRPDDVLDRQRRRQVLRDPARDLRRHLRRRRRRPRGRWTSSTSWTSARPSRRSSRRSSSTRWSSRCSSRWRCAACATGPSARPRCCVATCSSTASAG